MKVFTNLRLFDPYTDMIHENVSFSVSVDSNKVDNGRIVDIFYEEDQIEFKEPYETIDLHGNIVIPGFIDAHMHCESIFLVPSHTTFLAKRGTVVCIADPHEITNVLGKEGFEFFAEDAEKAVIDFRFTIPSCVPSTDFETAGANVTAKIVDEIIKQDQEKAEKLQKYSKYATNCHRIAGLGEVMNVPGVLDEKCDNIQEILSECRSKSTHIDGHSPGVTGTALNRYISAGISTDHECTTAEDLYSRLKRGMHVLIREGTAFASNAEELCTALNSLPRAATNRCAFCTDDRRMDDILEYGHIDNAIRIGIKCGLNPYDCIRMATLNPAIMFNLVDYGAIAPGKIASFSVLNGDIKECNIGRVFIRGNELITENEKPLIYDKSKISIMRVDINTITEKLEKAEFKGPAIGIIPDKILTTQEEKNESSNMIVCVERYSGNCNMGHAWINGVQLNKDCAVASTVAHDSHNIVCIGSSKSAIVKAIDALIKVGGGYSVSNNDEITVLPLPIAGLMTDATKPELLTGLREFRAALLKAGASDKYDLMMTLSFMCLPVIPKLKLTDKGLFDAETLQFVKCE